jgi:hypothetical protein
MADCHECGEEFDSDACCLNDAPIQTVTVITTAPVAYDYEWTVVRSKDIATGQRGRTYREVELDTRESGYYADYQMARYRSGAYAVLTPTEWSDLRDNYPTLV